MKKERILNGYRVLYKPDYNSPNVMKSDNWDGWIYEHRYVMEIHLGRTLDKNEDVHHIDGNKINNNPDNLKVLSQKEHARLHHPQQERKESICNTCGVTFSYPVYRTRKYCSHKCHKKTREKIEWPSDKELEKLVWEIPRSRLAKKLGVSDRAIAKRCKSREIPQPQRGYWTKNKK
jgi:hypothetical protein